MQNNNLSVAVATSMVTHFVIRKITVNMERYLNDLNMKV